MTGMKSSLRALLLAAAGIMMSVPDAAVASEAPLRIVVPYSAGGTTDQVARLLQRHLADVLGRSVIVENRPGAAGTIGTAAVARAQPDGNTLVFGNPGPNAIVPTFRDTGYDPLQDLQPVSTVAVMPMLLVVPQNSRFESLAAFLHEARRHPDTLNYGSSGIGSFAHLTGELFTRQAGLRMLHIPYAGGSPMMTALVQGDLQATFATGLDAATMVEAGKARYLAAAAAGRLANLPEVPAIEETLQGFRSEVWFGLFAPQGTPEELVGRLNAAVLQALDRGEIRDFLAARHARAQGSTPDGLAARVRDDMRQWGDLIRQAEIPM